MLLKATIGGWFTLQQSMDVALVSAGLSVGSTVMAPLARWMISSYDWRTAMLLIGDLAWLVIVPTALLVRNPPVSPAAAGTAATAADGPDLTVAQALRTPQFAAIALTYFACCATHPGPIFHLVTPAMDQGIAAMAAATLPSGAAPAAPGGQIRFGL